MTPGVSMLSGQTAVAMNTSVHLHLTLEFLHHVQETVVDFRLGHELDLTSVLCLETWMIHMGMAGGEDV